MRSVGRPVAALLCVVLVGWGDDCRLAGGLVADPRRSSPRDAEPRREEASAIEEPYRDPSGYTFVVDDEVREATFSPLDDLHAGPRPGDVALVYGWTVLLGQPGEIRILASASREGSTVRIGPDGAATIFAFDLVELDTDDRGGETALPAVEPALLRESWALSLARWDATAESLVGGIDPEGACVTVTEGAALGSRRRLPPLPRDLRCLVILGRREGFRDLSRLRTLRELRFLRIVSSKTVDGRWLARNTKLRYLAVSGRGALVHAEALASLDELIALDLSGSPEIDEVRFVATMSSLRRLDVTRTKVTDLSPIARSASLEEVWANEAPIDRLPETSVPSLRELRVVGTKLDDGAVSRFRALNPWSKVWHGWNASLEAVASEATRLRVRTGGICHRYPSGERTIAVVEGAGPVRDFMSEIAVVEGELGECACCGSLSIELYRDHELTAALSLQHGKRLRWREGWGADATLTDASRRALHRWLADRDASHLLR